MCTFGDAVLDVIVETSQLPVSDDDVPAEIALVAGGQAANVAAWSAVLGAEAAVVTKLGADPAGVLVREVLGQHGVEVHTAREVGTTGVIASLVTPDGRRTMASDRGASADFDPSELDARWFDGCHWLHVSGYALFGRGSSRAALAASELARLAGARVSVDLSTALLVTSVGRDEVRDRIAACGADLVFANEAEHAAAGTLAVPTEVVKRGAAGCTVIEGGSARDLAAVPAAVVRDTTGAGDAFAAGWLVGGAPLALAAASRCVALKGAMPAPLEQPPKLG